MTALPSGWQVRCLAELAADEPGAITDGPFGSKLTSAHYSDSGARVIRLQNIGVGQFKPADAFIPMSYFEELRKHEVRTGDLLVASLGDDPPRSCLAPAGLGPAIVKADCVRVRLADDVDRSWVAYAMQTPAVKSFAEAQMHGVGRLRLGLQGIRALPIPTAPLAEQRRIVELLDDHFSRLDAADAVLDDVTRRLTSFLKQVVRRILSGDGAAGEVELPPAGVDDGDLQPLPSGWRWARLGELADVVGGVTKDAKKQGAADHVDVPYLRVANVQRGRLELDSVTTIRVPATKAEALRLQQGDVLLNEGGDRDKLGRGWVWEGQIDDCIHQNHVFRARVRGGALDPYLLSWAGNTIGGTWCERNGRQSVNLASISLGKIRQMPVPVPPRDIQSQLRNRIDDAAAAARRAEHAVIAGRARSRVLRRSLLDAAFSGRLTSGLHDIESMEEPAGARA